MPVVNGVGFPPGSVEGEKAGTSSATILAPGDDATKYTRSMAPE